MQVTLSSVVQVWTSGQLQQYKGNCGQVVPVTVGQALPQIKQVRYRFQNTVPALETLAKEFYGYQKFAWAQKNNCPK